MNNCNIPSLSACVGANIGVAASSLATFLRLLVTLAVVMTNFNSSGWLVLHIDGTESTGEEFKNDIQRGIDMRVRPTSHSPHEKTNSSSDAPARIRSFCDMSLCLDSVDRRPI